MLSDSLIQVIQVFIIKASEPNNFAEAYVQIFQRLESGLPAEDETWQKSFESDAFIGTDPHVYIPALASGWKQLFFAAGLDYKYSPLSEFIRMSQTVRRNLDHLKTLKNTLLLRFLLKIQDLAGNCRI